jgi:parallel beta-helix repeat protein
MTTIRHSFSMAVLLIVIAFFHGLDAHAEDQRKDGPSVCHQPGSGKVEKPGLLGAGESAPAWKAFNQGKLERDRQNAQGAIEQFSRALSQKESWPLARALRAFAYQELGKQDSARQEAQTVLKNQPATTDEFLARGIALYIQKNYADAVRDLSQAIDRAPQYAVAYEMRGRARAANKDKDCAFEDLLKATNIEPQSLPAYAAIGATSRSAVEQYTVAIQRAPSNPWLYYFRAQSQKTKSAKVEDYSKAIALAPKEWRLYSGRGEAIAYGYAFEANYVAAVGDRTKAIELLTGAIKAEPQSDWLYRQRAALKQTLRDSKGALDDWAKAISVNPSSQNYRDRASFRLSLNDRRGALDDANKSIEVAPRDDEAYIFRANSRPTSEREAKLQDYAKALELNPTAGNFMSRASFQRYTIKNRKAALDDATKAIEIDPSDDNAYLLRADVKADLGDKSGALRDYDQAISLNQAYWSYRRRAAFKKDRLNDLAGALEDATRAIEVASDVAEAYAYRAEIKLTLKDTAGARRDYDELVSRNPSPENHRKRAYFMRYPLGDLQAALEYLNQAVKLWPSDPDNYTMRAEIRLALKDKAGALQDYAQLIKLYPTGANYMKRGSFKNGYEVQDAPGALEDATKAVEVEPNNDEAYKFRAGLRASAKDNEGALKDYDKAVSLNPSSENYKSRATFKADTLKDHQGALEDATKALQLFPRDGGLLKFRAELKAKAGDTQGALQDFEQFIQMVPDTWSYLNRASFKKYTLKDLKGAVEDTTKAIELDPYYDYNYKQRAELKVELKDFDGALEDYTKVIEIEPTAGNYESRASFRKQQLSDYYGALQDYAKAYELAPKNELLLRQAEIRSLQGDMDAALRDVVKVLQSDQPGWVYSTIENLGLTGNEDWNKKTPIIIGTYTKLVGMLPDHTELYVKRAGHRVYANDYQGALQDYNFAIAKDPKNVELYSKRADVKVNLKDFQGALQDYSEIILISPTAANYQRRARFKGNYLQDMQGDLEDASQAIRLSPGDPEVYAFRAETKKALKDLEGAIRDYSQAIALQPKGTGSDYYRTRGDLRKEIKDFAGAVQDYTKSIERDPNDSWKYRYRAEIRVQLGDLDGALKDYTKAIELYPKYANTYFERAKIKEQKGDLKGAIADCVKSLQVEPDNYYCKDYVGELRKKERTVSRTGSGPKTIAVAHDGSGDYTSIGQALKEAFSGDTLKIAPGTYVEPRFSINTSVTIIGNMADPAKVLIDMSTKDEFEKRWRQNVGDPVSFGGDDKETKLVKISGLTIKGGALSAYREELTLENVRFIGTEKRGEKGELIHGIRLGGSKPVLIKNCVVSGWGMGIAVDSAQNIKLEHNLIQDNDIGLDILGSQVALENNTIVRNTSPESHKYSNSGSGVYIGVYTNEFVPGSETASSVSLYNNIIAFNNKGIVVKKSDARIDYNDVYGNQEGNYINVTPSSSNLSVDPLFVDDMRGDYRLRAGSPLLSKGTGGTYIGAFGQGQR